jgi:hypothetical protein
MLLGHNNRLQAFAAEIHRAERNILPGPVKVRAANPRSHIGEAPARRLCGVGRDSTWLSVVPATLSGFAKGSGEGCNSELGFCGMSGKSGGKVGGRTGGASGWGLSSSGLGMA